MPETAYDEEYRDGVLIKRTQRTVSDAEILRRDAPARLRAQYSALRQWSQDAAAVAAAGGTPTAAQQRALFDRFGKLCDGLADLLITQALDQ
jgi:hypothetical protein